MDSDVTVTTLAGSAWLVELTGEHDLATAPTLTDALDEIHAQGTDVVLDLTRTSFLDSSIVGVIVGHAAKPGERVVVVAPRESPGWRVLELIQLGTVLRIVDTRAEALESLGEP
jgi:anti-anti-sigma factor